MNILFIHQYFKTPNEPGATRIYFIVKRLMEHGHHVTVVTQSKGAKVGREVKEVDGIQVVYLKNAYSNHMSIPMRLKSFANFMMKASIEVFNHKRMDLVIATSTPLSVGLPALLLKWFRNVPFIFEVRDLWPEVPIQMGGIKNPIVKKLAIGFEKLIYRNARHIVTLSPGMYAGVARYVDANKISMIPNMAKIDRFWPRAKNVGLEKELGLKSESIKVIHFGTMGIANGLLYMLEAAKILQDQGEHDIVFVLLGEGRCENDLRHFTEIHHLRNVHFYKRVPMDLTSEIINLCDISLVSFKDIPILSTNSPNKLFDSLAAGKPIIVNSDGWTRKLVEDSQCGAYVDPNKPEALAQLLVDWKHKPQWLTAMANNSRQLAVTTYSESRLTKEYVDIVNALPIAH